MADQEAPLLVDIQRLADTLGPADVPHTGSTANILGAIVKVLEHQGITVAEELFPAEAPVAETAVLAAQAAPDAVNALERLIARAEDAVKALSHHTQAAGGPAADPGNSAPSPASAADTPATGAGHPEGSSEASPGPVVPAGPGAAPVPPAAPEPAAEPAAPAAEPAAEPAAPPPDPVDGPELDRQ